MSPERASTDARDSILLSWGFFFVGATRGQSKVTMFTTSWSTTALAIAISYRLNTLFLYGIRLRKTLALFFNPLCHFAA
ncbi:hypothetical protein LIPSTDRAFT_68761 [Lipomyces starkeyi NRRL Y-11557]|uniref:Uncharacterized protein n=1 Tax=Lipomyces starkeyi NRRL Y-11557 TaxID=675824 RepID=A0A1E3QAT6_LIPST|nr:hypothetical protein LIPSTDRAFT_68761 [Lipomyces starkeyi NRRL Y-11557]